MTAEGRARRRQATIRKLQEAGVDPNVVDHVYDKQVEPQRRAFELQAAGHDVDAVMVNTSPDTLGHEVSCGGCGRTARLPFAPPAGRVVICPDCQHQ